MRSRGSTNSGAEDMRKLYTWLSFTDYSKRNSHISNYILYVTVCCGTPMLSFIVYIFLCFHFILFIRKEKMIIYLLLSSFYISFVSPQ